MAIWGGGDIADIMMGARHKTVKHSMTYQRDARFLLALAEKNGLKLPVTPWKPIYCKDYQMGRSINAQSLGNFTSISKMSEDFVIKTLNISKDHPSRSVKFILQQAMRYSSPTSTHEKITKVLSTIDNEKAKELSSLIEQYAVEYSKKTKTGGESMDVEVTTEPEHAIVENPIKKRARGGENNLDL